MQGNQRVYKSNKSNKQYKEVDIIKQGAILIVKDEQEQLYILKKQSTLRKQEKMFYDMVIIKQLKILKIYQYFEMNNDFYIITEYCKGGNLQKELQSKVKFSEQEATKIILDISKQLEAIHAQECIYYDLKPSNIVLQKIENNKISFKLCDFQSIILNCQSEIEEQEQSSKEKSPNYKAPEELNLVNFLSKKVDIWGLGVVSFFDGAFNKEIFRKISSYEVNSEKQNLPNLKSDQKIKAFIQSLLYQKPEQRTNLEQIQIFLLKRKAKCLKETFKIEYQQQTLQDRQKLDSLNLELEKALRLCSTSKKEFQDLNFRYKQLLEEQNQLKQNYQKETTQLKQQVQSFETWIINFKSEISQLTLKVRQSNEKFLKEEEQKQLIAKENAQLKESSAKIQKELKDSICQIKQLQQEQKSVLFNFENEKIKCQDLQQQLSKYRKIKFRSRKIKLINSLNKC